MEPTTGKGEQQMGDGKKATIQKGTTIQQSRNGPTQKDLKEEAGLAEAN